MDRWIDRQYGLIDKTIGQIFIWIGRWMDTWIEKLIDGKNLAKYAYGEIDRYMDCHGDRQNMLDA